MCYLSHELTPYSKENLLIYKQRENKDLQQTFWDILLYIGCIEQITSDIITIYNLGSL